jgi:glycosyltransferase involved in cell wall biosynthesis
MAVDEQSGGAPKVSVVIPAYNAEDYVRQTLDSVLAQTFTDYEVIMVNDASTDSTPDLLREYERKGRFRVVTHEVNKGLAAARNSGIRCARGEFVTFLDADDLWRPEKLDYQLRVLEAHPEINFLSNSSLWFRDGETPAFPPLPDEPELRPVDWRSLVLGASPFSA